MESKFIFLRDPWRVVEDNDTGWGNRLRCWGVAVQLRELLGNVHEIVVLEKEFPELHLLELPYTSFVQKAPKATKIQDVHVSEWVEEKLIRLDEDTSYETDFSYDSNTILINTFFSNYTKHFSKIKTKDARLQSALEEFSRDRIGVHIRRGNGVHLTEEDLQTIPSKYRKYYRLCPECDPYYRFYPDEKYFNFLDRALEDDKWAQIYISADVKESATKYYKDKYEGKVCTLSDFITNYSRILERADFLRKIGKLRNIGANLIDFLILANSKHIVCSKHSSWSSTAKAFYNRPSTTIE